jgi:hypothetical protein
MTTVSQQSREKFCLSHKESDILTDIAKLLVLAAVPPRLYGLPVIYKEDISWRPAVYCITSLAYRWAEYLMA